MFFRVYFTIFRVGNGDALSVVTAEAPRVEGALEGVALDAAAHSHVDAQMRTVGVQHERLPALATKHREILTLTQFQIN